MLGGLPSRRIEILRAAGPLILANMAAPLLGLSDTAVIGNTGLAVLAGCFAFGARDEARAFAPDSPITRATDREVLEKWFPRLPEMNQRLILEKTRVRPTPVVRPTPRVLPSRDLPRAHLDRAMTRTGHV